MAKRCTQCDKPIHGSRASPDQRQDICTKCAERNLRKKSERRHHLPGVSERPKKAEPKSMNASASMQPNPEPTNSSIPLDIELDTDDPMLLAAGCKADEEEEPSEAFSELEKLAPPEEQDADVEEKEDPGKQKPPL